jgi:hypothetical protein
MGSLCNPPFLNKNKCYDTVTQYSIFFMVQELMAEIKWSVLSLITSILEFTVKHVLSGQSVR